MKIKLEDGAYMPTKTHDADAGYDLYSMEDRRIWRFESEMFDTGVHMEIPKGYCGLVFPRSGLNARYSVAPFVGVIDSGFTGTVKTKLYNLSMDNYKVRKGDRIAQIVFVKCESPEFEIVDELEETERGEDGLGSSGK